MTTDPERTLRVSALLSVQRALLGMVSCDLRAVELTIAAQRVHGTFAYDGEIAQEHLEIVDEVETLVIADLCDDVEVRFEAVSVRPPEPVDVVRETILCYLRRE